MSSLHGSWIEQENKNYFFIWGEGWKTVKETSPPLHPFALDAAALTNFLATKQIFSRQVSNLTEFLQSRWQKIDLVLPSKKSGKKKLTFPILSANLDSINLHSEALFLANWQVTGIKLTPVETVDFLQKLPLNTALSSNNYLGEDLIFWTQIYRWVLDLIARKKFLPGIKQLASKEIISYWQPLIDSNTDHIRLAKFTQLMPAVCTSYNLQEELQNLTAIQAKKHKILLSFISKVLDSQLRQWLEYSYNTKAVNIEPWLISLTQTNQAFDYDEKQYKRLNNALDNWTLPIQEYLANSANCQLGENQYRVCLTLRTPKTYKGKQLDWQLSYGLQAVEQPDFVVDAPLIWQWGKNTLTIGNRIIEQPQETLLKGLGLAARFYQPIATSLNLASPSVCQLNPIEAYEFIRSTARQLEDSGIGVILPPGLAPGKNETRLGIKINAQVEQPQGERLSLKTLLKYNLEIAVGEQTLSSENFQALLAQKSPLVEINGQWIALQPADVKAAQAVLERKNEIINLTVEDALRFVTGDSKTLAKLPVVKFSASGVLQELITNLTENKTVEPLPEPVGFQGKLRPYQQRGVGWLAFLEKWSLGACLADDMGLGKTIQLIAFLLHLKQNGAYAKPVLLICPTSVITNWEKEVNRFAPTLKTLIHHGDDRSKGKAFQQKALTSNLIITSYPLVYRDLETLQKVMWEGIVLDEAQNIKNPTAKQSQAVKNLSGGFKIALTGTPIENRLSELWSILDFLNPGFLGSRQFFQKRFATPIEKYGDTDSLHVLRSLVQPFILRRLKTDINIIQDLPEKQEMNVFCGLSAQQAELYQSLVEQSLREIDKAAGIQRRGMILTLLLRLKQLCNHPILLQSKPKPPSTWENFSSQSGKLLRLEEMLEELISEGDRALIFTQFSEWGKLLQPYLQARLQREVIFLYGATRRQQRQAMVERFQNDPDAPPVFILSLKAGGTGLNLTRANHVFHVDRWWNPAVENQATDRAFRIGQTKNVQVHKFISTGTLEERIDQMIASKKELAETTVDAGENWLTELDTEQLRNLLFLERDGVMIN